MAILRMAIQLRIQIGWQQSGFRVNQEELDDSNYLKTLDPLTLCFKFVDNENRNFDYENKIHYIEKSFGNDMSHIKDVKWRKINSIAKMWSSSII